MVLGVIIRQAQLLLYIDNDDHESVVRFIPYLYPTKYYCVDKISLGS